GSRPEGQPLLQRARQQEQIRDPASRAGRQKTGNARAAHPKVCRDAEQRGDDLSAESRLDEASAAEASRRRAASRKRMGSVHWKLRPTRRADVPLPTDIDTTSPKFLRDKYAIVGVGETAYMRGSGRTTRVLATWAVRNAMED